MLQGVSELTLLSKRKWYFGRDSKVPSVKWVQLAQDIARLLFGMAPFSISANRKTISHL